jgi:diaminopimelate decarboxylase
MHHFHYRDRELCAEEVPLRELAERHGTPLFVYSHATLVRHVRRYQSAFGDSGHKALIAFSVKANSNLAIIRALANEGAGADVVSLGELERALAAGVPPERIVFAGVGKRPDELRRGVEAGILQFNVEVEAELDHLEAAGRELGRVVPIALRVNPDVTAQTHDYIRTGGKVNKFGIPWERAQAVYARAAASPHLRPVGLACHIGSQILTLDPFKQALERVAGLVRELRTAGLDVPRLDVGGGLGVRYRDEIPPSLEDYAATVIDAVADLGCELICEPGRVIMANAGVLLTRVLYRKETADKRFLIVDQGMNDLSRPALYGAYHEVIAVRKGAAQMEADVVGPICETGDFLSRGGSVPDVEPGELICAMSAGAYGRSMSSNYNTRPRAPEVLVRGADAFLIRPREVLSDLWAKEEIPDFLSEG